MSQTNKPPFFDVRMRGFRQRRELAELTGLIADRIQPLGPESVELTDAANRVLAEPICSEVAVPGFARAAMDGYALRGEETFGASAYSPLEFKIVGQSLPAQPYPEALQPGQAIRIMTGAPLPEGGDAVLQAEAAEERDGRLIVNEPTPPGRHVGQIGEDIERGASLFQAGRLLRPQDLGILASIGAAKVTVLRKPTVAVLVTGNELLPCGAKPTEYQIVDSNSIMLKALAMRDGAASVRVQMIRDDRNAVAEALTNAKEDLTFASGGSSVGVEDHMPQLIAELGELCIHGVALRPASPTGFGFVGVTPIFLIPGNPVSCLCAYDLIAGAAVRRLGGRNADAPYREVQLPLRRKITSAVGRVDYVRIRIVDGAVEPLATKGASILSSTSRADGYVVVPSDLEGYAEGDVVRVRLYDRV